jgi:K+-transporting ATPase KdpF subunit
MWHRGQNAGLGIRFDCNSLFRGELGIRERMRPPMTLEYTISLLIAAGVGVYLVYALLRPERF